MGRAKLVVATKNPDKLKEIAAALQGLDLEVEGLPATVQLPEETGTTFEENAEIKARAAWESMPDQAKCTTLADDSGLCVDALGGAPGIYSARYAPTTEERNARLLRELEGVPLAERKAQFVSVIVIVTRAGYKATVTGTCAGTIGLAPRGRGGFGYDPIFVLPDGRTMAELDLAEKNRISHRGKAMAAMRGALSALMREGAL